MLDNFFFDQISFWLGFTAAIIIWWLIKQSRPIFDASKDALSKQSGIYQNKFSNSIEHRYRKDLLAIVQENHLASPLFSLSEIGIEPRIMAPPYPVVPDGPLPTEDIADLVIPYMPEWPEMAATYGLQSLSMAEALDSGQNLAIIGKPGIGKSFALNTLCAQVARRDSEMGSLRNMVPLIAHVGDLEIPVKLGDSLNVFYKVLAEKVSTLVESQLPKYIQTIFKNNSVLLLIDGMDELPKNAQMPVIDFLNELRDEYPELRMVVTLSTEDLYSVGPLGLFPVSLAAWNAEQTEEFFNRWDDLWGQFVLNETWAENLPKSVDSLIFKNWLKLGKKHYSPLEITLKTWAVYAGDAVGPSLADSVEAYINRMTSTIKNAIPALQQLALQMVISSNPMIARKSAGKFVAEFEGNPPAQEIDPLPEEEIEEVKDENPFMDDDLRKLLAEFDDPPVIDEEPKKKEKKKKNKPEKNKIRTSAVRRILPELVESKVLNYRSNASLSFSHPMILSYLAGDGFAKRNDGNQLISDSKWSGHSMTLNFLSRKADVSKLIPMMIEKDKNDPLKTGVQMMSHWATQTSPTPSWMSNLLRVFVGILRREDLPMGYRGRILTALASSGQLGVDALFRQLMKEEKTSVNILGALGSGILQDQKAVDDLGQMLNSGNITGSRAACMALVAIDTDRALEMVAGILLDSTDEGQRAAAEALSRHPREGYEFLREGSKMEDFSIRRAIVYGLTWIDELWAKDILRDMELNDDQWVVRNAAAHALESDLHKVSRIPVPIGEISNLPWLTTFAGEQGMGLSEGQASWDMLALAIREGKEDQILGAMDILRLNPFKARAAVSDIYKVSEGPAGELKEAAFNTLWQLGAMGVDIGGYL
ncbi:MAG: NACHT domain-containing protein [Chloroflexi bacterium]|jgi:hypothetical protein|nr:NACHT domain-containing protein [Chloroflexota bacterium]MBT3670438.1 NACHT domain-containing protein [Chloroflexota bacterium]MBT4304660.1 NACHT domain-containing protein [Chloroflexota bacterium]MBT4534229.1 NACHT domain-containing protein [Chloroflexota bacterium]MBT4681981.1 NACHT domain-containing protein [Chloroflexota bacterium]